MIKETKWGIVVPENRNSSCRPRRDDIKIKSAMASLAPWVLFFPLSVFISPLPPHPLTLYFWLDFPITSITPHSLMLVTHYSYRGKSFSSHYLTYLCCLHNIQLLIICSKYQEKFLSSFPNCSMSICCTKWVTSLYSFIFWVFNLRYTFLSPRWVTFIVIIGIIIGIIGIGIITIGIRSSWLVCR